MLNKWSFAILAFFMTTGGPNGIEEAVQAAGGLYTILGFIFFAIFYSLPQSLMTCELSLMIPGSGGYIQWVHRGLGPFYSFINSWNCVLCNLFDNALYPNLLSYSIISYFPQFKTYAYTIKFITLSLITIVNILGIELVTKVCYLLSLLVMLPF